MDPHARSGLSRREFLRSAGVGAAGLSLAAILAACSEGSSKTATMFPGPVSGSPTNPTVLPLYEDNAAIASGLPVERGATLKIYQRGEYLYDDVIRSFVHRYRDAGIDAQVESFTNVDDAVARLVRPGSDFDVFFPSIESLRTLVPAKMLLPLNHDYLPNRENLWPQFLPPGPSYDAEMRYTTPYTIFTTGIAWRADLVDPADAPDRLENPYEIFWNPRYQVGFYPSYREGLATGLLRDGLADPNRAIQPALTRAATELSRIDSPKRRLQVAGDTVSDGLPDGNVAVTQAWSGDILTARRYALHPRNWGPTVADELRFHWPAGGVIGADLSAVLAQGKNPVLAHAFLNHLLDMDVALENFGWNGYQPPVTCAVPEMFAAGSKWHWITGPNLISAIARPEDLDAGTMLLPLDPSTDARWQRAWQSVAGS